MFEKTAFFRHDEASKSTKQLEKSQFGTFSTQIGICVLAMASK